MIDSLPVRRRPGFTVVELLTVLVMIGILTAMAAPRIDVTRLRANAAMQAVGTGLHAAQRDAVARQHDVLVLLDTTRNEVRIVYDANNDGQVSVGERIRTIPLDPVVRFGRAGAPSRPFGSESVSFTKTVGGVPVLVFRRNGSASAEGGLYLTTERALAAPSRYVTDVRAIEVVRAVGRAEWLRYQANGWVRGF
jgi:prepilin-type N-terminal cleavage/methylation domain-containing protein